MKIKALKDKYRDYPEIIEMLTKLEDLRDWADEKYLEIETRQIDIENRIKIATDQEKKVLLREEERLKAELDFFVDVFDEKWEYLKKELLIKMQNKNSMI